MRSGVRGIRSDDPSCAVDPEGRRIGCARGIEHHVGAAGIDKAVRSRAIGKDTDYVPRAIDPKRFGTGRTRNIEGHEAAPGVKKAVRSRAVRKLADDGAAAPSSATDAKGLRAGRLRGQKGGDQKGRDEGESGGTADPRHRSDVDFGRKDYWPKAARAKGAKGNKATRTGIGTAMLHTLWTSRM